MTQRNQIVIIVVGCMLIGFVVATKFVPEGQEKHDLKPFQQDIERPIAQETSMRNPGKGPKKALTIIETHKSHIESIQGHINKILILSGHSDTKIASLQDFQRQLSGELRELDDIEDAIIHKSKSPREIKKFMEELRPGMKELMGNLKTELHQDRPYKLNPQKQN